MNGHRIYFPLNITTHLASLANSVIINLCLHYRNMSHSMLRHMGMTSNHP
jgi:hypothetical protein